MKRIIAILMCLLLLAAGAMAEPNLVLPDWAEGALQIPSCVKVIEAGAFEGTGLDDIVIGSGVESIASGAFAGNDGPIRVCILNDSITIAEDAFGTGEVEIWSFLDSSAEDYAENNDLGFVRLYTYEDNLMTYARGFLGQKYVHGSMDCVLFVYKVYRDVYGIKLPDTCPAMEKLSASSLVRTQKLTVQRIDDLTDLRTGDILCWCNDEVDYCTHVGLYVGACEVRYTAKGSDGLMHEYVEKHKTGDYIEASSSAGKVRYNNIPFNNPDSYYVRNFICAWRVLP